MEKNEIIEKIKEYDTIIIHRHVRPDPDAYGSQAGLREIIQESFPEKEVYIVGEEEPSLQFLVKMDEIADAIYDKALVIVCDTANRPRISDERYILGDYLIKIDHHPDESPYGDSLWVDTTASSTSEMIYELYLTAKKHDFKINDEAAQLLYAGIVGDTGRFLFPSATGKTFRYAADLVQFDFNRTVLYDGIYNISTNIARLRGYILENFKLEKSGMSSVFLTKEILEKFNVTANETGQLVNTLGDIKDLIAFVYFIEEEDVIRVRLRSKGPIINTIAQKFSGGGHPLASGAAVYSIEEANQLIKELDHVCIQYNEQK